jgi:hypothetical protein
MLNFVVFAFPLVASRCMTDGSRLAMLDHEANLLATTRTHAGSYLRIGALGTFWFIGVFTSISFVGTLAIADTVDGTILGLRQRDSLWVALATKLPVICASVCEFHPAAAHFLRRAIGVVSGGKPSEVRLMCTEVRSAYTELGEVSVHRVG